MKISSRGLPMIFIYGVFLSLISTIEISAYASSPPTIVSVPKNIASVGEPYRYDDDGLPTAKGTPPIRWELVTENKDAKIDAETGEIIWTPATWGEVYFTLKAINDFGSDEQGFLVVVLAPPKIISTPNTTTGAYRSYQYDSNGALEAEGSEPIIWSLIEGPTGFIVEGSTGKVTWTPTESGSFPIAVRAENLVGSDEQSFTVVVTGASKAPVIDKTANLSATLGKLYIYDDDRKASAQGLPPIKWSKKSAPDEFKIEQNSGLITWVPLDSGDVPIAIAATNSEGSDEYSFTVKVVAEEIEPPNAVIVAEPNSGNAPLKVIFDASQSSSSSGAQIVEYRWNFGDDSPPKSGIVAEHTYLAAGAYIARLSVADNWGQTGAASIAITVSAQTGETPPSAKISYDKLEGKAPLTVKFSVETEDPDIDKYTVLWDYGDGDRSYEFNPSHTFYNPGAYHTSLTVLAPSGLEATDKVVVVAMKGEKRPPLAEAYAEPSMGDAPLTVRFISSAGDFDGVITFMEWDFGGDDKTQNLNPIRTFTEQGIYEVSFTAIDNDGLSSAARLEIRVTRDGKLPPKIISLPNLSINAGLPYRYDDDGIPSARGDQPIKWKLGKELAGETINIPEGMEIDETTGEIKWTPSDEQGGINKVTLRAENTAGSDFQDFAVTVIGGKEEVDGGSSGPVDGGDNILDGGDSGDDGGDGCGCRVR